MVNEMCDIALRDRPPVESQKRTVGVVNISIEEIFYTEFGREKVVEQKTESDGNFGALFG